MLQFLTHKSNKYSISEEAQMALEGGCKWIQVTASLNDGDTLREVVEQIMPLCEENEAFMVIDSDVELCNELRVHGVHLHKGDMAPAEARELLGPHAVIGVDADTAEEIIPLQAMDIDYAAVGPFSDKFTINDYRDIINSVRQAGVATPVVAYGKIGFADLIPLLGAGVNGFAVSEIIINADDPAEATKQILSTITAK